MVSIKTDYSEKSNISTWFDNTFLSLREKIDEQFNSLTSNTTDNSYKKERKHTHCQKNLLTIKEVEQQLRIGHTAMYETILNQNLLPSIKIGRRRFILADDLNAFIKQSKMGVSYD